MRTTALDWPVSLSLLVTVFVFSCSGSPGNGVTPETLKEGSGPPTAQIKSDLVGRAFIYFISGNDPNWHHDRMVGIWTVGEGELQEFEILRRFPNLKRTYGERTDEIHAMVTLTGAGQKIRGVLVFQYAKGEKGWDLYLLGPRDGDRHHDFSFERIQTSDGKVIAAMAPANPPIGPWRFAPTPSTTPIPELRGPEIQVW
ncbi:MAG: hypothetical protein ACREL3_02585 [Gemmatimonadales bacterium]